MIRRLALLAVALAAPIAVAGPPTIVVAPPGSGPVARAHTRTWHHHGKTVPPGRCPVARAHTRTWHHHGKTVRMIRRTPDVMREDGARIKRGDLFSTWSNAAAN